jgi:hypothetical protein
MTASNVYDLTHLGKALPVTTGLIKCWLSQYLSRPERQD